MSDCVWDVGAEVYVCVFVRLCGGGIGVGDSIGLAAGLDCDAPDEIARECPR
jgi:hypothetical protein